MKFPLLQKVALVMLLFLNLADILLIADAQEFESNPLAIASWNTIGFIPSAMVKMGFVLVSGIVSYLILRTAKPKEIKPLTILSNLSFVGYVTYYSALFGWNCAMRMIVFGV